ncbi:hypothetical protein HanRHA438_Chr08g0372991 [Helianthus annuus]|uniref:Uncharacterized protein n=1 Tax=Helianthus annuus TaxID=4232 RepID=A0A251U8M6_HELAN|nr:hypothetical protein HanXRQr2_Chr08g0361481 [Helianthus annuus]KAJ0540458.1 hypothetical protein HanHA300_Chr08g0298431 [Helianthus annuus]KAJ0549004.1 hypothetical protein HanIR_Chr08g0390171 [Helianthus annuus]KAJ0555214.1 hypothetical protein HanHA89_Chr08g0317051 [Helianthus annuus]KAJ0899826.1 hypothetical protein HanRHA438_Chr08g0372991 [Helianthus annuus]
MKLPSRPLIIISHKNSKDVFIFLLKTIIHCRITCIYLNQIRDSQFSLPLFFAFFSSVFDFCLIPSALFMRFDVWLGFSDG